MAHAALAPWLISKPYCSLFVFSNFFPWACSQQEEKVTVNIALTPPPTNPPPSLHTAPPSSYEPQPRPYSSWRSNRRRWVSTSFLWEVFKRSARNQKATSNSHKSINVKDHCSEITWLVFSLKRHGVWHCIVCQWYNRLVDWRLVAYISVYRELYIYF